MPVVLLPTCNILHVSTSDSAACELGVEAAGYASTSDFAVSAGKGEGVSLCEHQRSSARLRDIIVQCRLTLLSQSMVTPSFKQDATKDLELGEINDSLGHGSNGHVITGDSGRNVAYKWGKMLFETNGRLTIGQSCFNSP